MEQGWTGNGWKLWWKKSNLVNLASWSRRRGLMRNRCACRKGQVIGKVWNSVGEKENLRLETERAVVTLTENTESFLEQSNRGFGNQSQNKHVVYEHQNYFLWKQYECFNYTVLTSVPTPVNVYTNYAKQMPDLEVKMGVYILIRSGIMKVEEVNSSFYSLTVKMCFKKWFNRLKWFYHPKLFGQGIAKTRG